MSAAAIRARVKRLKVLLDGFGKETNAALADRGVLTLQEWNRHIRAILNARTALEDAHMGLSLTLDRLEVEASGSKG